MSPGLELASKRSWACVVYICLNKTPEIMTPSVVPAARKAYITAVATVCISLSIALDSVENETVGALPLKLRLVMERYAPGIQGEVCKSLVESAAAPARNMVRTQSTDLEDTVPPVARMIMPLLREPRPEPKGRIPTSLVL